MYSFLSVIYIFIPRFEMKIYWYYEENGLIFPHLLTPGSIVRNGPPEATEATLGVHTWSCNTSSFWQHIAQGMKIREHEKEF